MPDLKKEAERIREEIKAVNAQLDEAKSHHKKLVDPLRFRLSQIADDQRDIESSKKELRETCTNPDLLNELKTLTEELNRNAELIRKKSEDELRQAQISRECERGQLDDTVVPREERQEFRSGYQNLIDKKAKQVETLAAEDSRLRNRQQAILQRQSEIGESLTEVWPVNAGE